MPSYWVCFRYPWLAGMARGLFWRYVWVDFTLPQTWHLYVDKRNYAQMYGILTFTHLLFPVWSVDPVCRLEDHLQEKLHLFASHGKVCIQVKKWCRFLYSLPALWSGCIQSHSCISVLFCLCRSNAVVQTKVFERMDKLLDIPGCPQELGLCLAEVRCKSYCKDIAELYLPSSISGAIIIGSSVHDKQCTICHERYVI